MARPVRIRERYTADRSRLTRLEEAVEKDPRVTAEEKIMLHDLLRKAVSLFITIDDRLHAMPALPSVSAASKTVRRGRRKSGHRKAA